MAKGKRRDRMYLRGDVWWCWGYDYQGKRWRESTHQRDDKAAELVFRQLEREKAATPHQPKRSAKADLTLEQALLRYLRFQETAGRAENTIEATTLHVRHLLHAMAESKVEHRLTPDMKVDDIKLAHTSEYVACRLAEPDAGPGIRHTVAKELTALLAAMRQAAKKELCAPRVYSELWPEELGRKVYKPRKRFLTVEEMQYLVDELEHADTDANRHEYLLMYCNTGMRRAELFDVRPEHFDATQQDVFIDGTKTEEAARRIPLTRVAVQILKSRIASSKDGVLFPVWDSIVRDLKAACERIQARWNPEYHAIADETRALILRYLERRPAGASTAELADLVGMRPHRVVWHLNILRDTRMVTCTGRLVKAKEGSGRGNQRNVAIDSRVWALDPEVFERALASVGGDLDAPKPRRPFPPVTPNDLRRTFCSWLVQRGIHERVAAQLMGHKDTTMVRAVYGQLDLATTRHAIGAIDGHRPTTVTKGVTKTGAKQGESEAIRDMATPQKPRKTA